MKTLPMMILPGLWEATTEPDAEGRYYVDISGDALVEGVVVLGVDGETWGGEE